MYLRLAAVLACSTLDSLSLGYLAVVNIYEDSDIPTSHCNTTIVLSDLFTVAMAELLTCIHHNVVEACHIHKLQAWWCYYRLLKRRICPEQGLNRLD